jgi:prepilin-type N-terminal cleavage/methylation domain-containing protein
MYRSKRKSAEARGCTAGFTLFEVVIALIIAGLGMTMLLAAASQGLGNTQTADRYLEATRRAQSRLAEIGVTVPLLAGVRTGDDGNGFTWRTRISEPLIHKADPTKPDQKPLALFTVEAAIGWRADGQVREVSLQSKRLARP